MDGTFRILMEWAPTDIHITPIYDGALGAEGLPPVSYEVSVVVRKIWTAREESIVRALLNILRQLDREG